MDVKVNPKEVNPPALARDRFFKNPIPALVLSRAKISAMVYNEQCDQHVFGMPKKISNLFRVVTG